MEDEQGQQQLLNELHHVLEYCQEIPSIQEKLNRIFTQVTDGEGIARITPEFAIAVGELHVESRKIAHETRATDLAHKPMGSVGHLRKDRSRREVTFTLEELVNVWQDGGTLMDVLRPYVLHRA